MGKLERVAKVSARGSVYFFVGNFSSTVLLVFASIMIVRLIFEMWVYDEGVKGFRYNGRWFQIWLNVTQR